MHSLEISTQTITVKRTAKCLICLDTGCNTCTRYTDVKQLSKRLYELEEFYNFVNGISNVALKLKPQQIATTNIFKRSSSPILLSINMTPDELPYWKFITITFDPNKFGVGNQSADEKNYILWVLIQLKNYYSEVYGCFEYTKQGTVHSHLIMNIVNNGNLKKDLKQYFTNNPRNQHAVDIEPAKFPNALNYINKIGIKEKDRGDEWFLYEMAPGNDDLDYIAPSNRAQDLRN